MYQQRHESMREAHVAEKTHTHTHKQSRICACTLRAEEFPLGGAYSSSELLLSKVPKWSVEGGFPIHKSGSSALLIKVSTREETFNTASL
mmetsp:Transcript_2407/g.3195  ORF Transcript_2407/g.3195 Transcript_2407/m.3195 type:complete len:90 (-) Transcript_2407:649-918(-)